MLAVYERRTELLELIIKSVMDRKSLLKQHDIYGNYATHLAVLNNFPDILDILLKIGAPKESQNFVFSSRTQNKKVW